MNYRDLTNILLKIAGVVLIVFAIIWIPAYVSYFFAQQDRSLLTFIGMSVIPFSAPLTAGFMLLLFPATISNRIIAGCEDPAGKGVDLPGLERVAFSVIGVYLLSRVVSDMAYHITSLVLLAEAGGGDHYNTGYEHPYALIAATLAEFGMALYLLLGSAGLVRVLNKVRARAVD